MGIVLKTPVDPQAVLEGIELIDVSIRAAVDMLGFGDKPKISIRVHIVLDKNPFVEFLRRSVTYQELVFIELNFLLALRVDHSNPRTSIIQEDVFEFV
jgi:hypothetical protein